MSFLELPYELRECVFNALPVHDRARLNMAMPKSMKFKVDAGKERRLGVFSSAVRKRRVSKLSARAREFLSTVPCHDVTLCEMAAVLPDVGTVEHRGPAPRPSLYDKRRAGLLTAEDVAAVLAEMSGRGIITFLAGASPEFVEAFGAQASGAWRAIVSGPDIQSLLFDVVNCGNEALLAHLLGHREAFMIRKESLAEFSSGQRVSILCSCAGSPRDMLFKHFDVPVSKIRDLYQHAADNVDAESMLFYEARGAWDHREDHAVALH